MKKLILLSFLAFALIFTGCNKLEDEKVNDPASGEGEIVFTGQTVDINQLKNGQDADDIAEYALITIKDGDGNETIYNRAVYYIGNVPYTQAIKLPNGDYSVELFRLMDDFKTPNNLTDDVEIYATPMVGSEYAGYVSTPTAFTFTIEAFKKIEIPIEVIRFEASEWESFGFTWFVIEESIIYEHCFFGDLCVKNPADYDGSLYAQQTAGLQMDMPAIAYIEVWQESTKDNDTDYELTGTFSNESYLGEGEPLCVTYEDYNLYADEYKLKLFILVADGEDFSYKHFLTWEFTDETAEQVLVTGEDGITDYVLGTCVPDADFMIPPYMNLPATATYTITSYAPGNQTGAYTDALIDVDPGYEIYDGTWPSWCFDYQTTIYVNQAYTMDVYSSLYPDALPANVAAMEWDKANWLMNHLDWYDGYNWEDLQGALWMLEGWNGSAVGGLNSGITAIAQQMYDDMMAYGDGYMPLPGGWAAVIFVAGEQVQTVFIVVDP